ncbi:MAG: peptidyl-prolyl cis-trans isomerase [Candidatus Sumerlaeota bacterium]|nr:peptidyl-prolyl cis-trans isomerase [Candidatus Sumerlaeota bacterium]
MGKRRMKGGADRLLARGLALLVLGALVGSAAAQVRPARPQETRPPNLMRPTPATPAPAAAMPPLVGPDAASQPAGAPTPRPFVRPNTSEPIAAVVDSRCLTVAQLNNRVYRLMYMMQDQIPLKDERVKESWRLRLELMVMTEWVQLTLLAVHAQTEGFTATPKEVDERIQDILKAEDSESQGQGVSPALAALRGVGISHEELLGYVTDAILAEKLVQSRLSTWVTESDMQRLYNLEPDLFMTPPRLHVYYLRMQLTGNESLDDKRRLKDKMEEWRDKAAKKGKFLEVAQQFNQPEIGQYGGDYQWVTPNSLPVSTEKTDGSVSLGTQDSIVRDVFGLKDGEVSKVLTSQFGFWVFQAVERREATGLDFNSARDKVENAVYQKAREEVIAQVCRQHTIIMNAGGIDFDELEKKPVDKAALVAEQEKQFKEFRRNQYERLMTAKEENNPANKKVWEIPKESLDILRGAKVEPGARPGPAEAATPSPTPIPIQ